MANQVLILTWGGDRHPYYAGLHFNHSMTSLLLLEWASFRLQGHDQAALRKLRAEPAGTGSVQFGSRWVRKFGSVG